MKCSCKRMLCASLAAAGLTVASISGADSPSRQNPLRSVATQPSTAQAESSPSSDAGGGPEARPESAALETVIVPSPETVIVPSPEALPSPESLPRRSALRRPVIRNEQGQATVAGSAPVDGPSAELTLRDRAATGWRASQVIIGESNGAQNSAELPTPIKLSPASERLLRMEQDNAATVRPAAPIREEFHRDGAGRMSADADAQSGQARGASTKISAPSFDPAQQPLPPSADEAQADTAGRTELEHTPAARRFQAPNRYQRASLSGRSADPSYQAPAADESQSADGLIEWRKTNVVRPAQEPGADHQPGRFESISRPRSMRPSTAHSSSQRGESAASYRESADDGSLQPLESLRVLARQLRDAARDVAPERPVAARDWARRDVDARHADSWAPTVGIEESGIHQVQAIEEPTEEGTNGDPLSIPLPPARDGNGPATDDAPAPSAANDAEAMPLSAIQTRIRPSAGNLPEDYAARVFAQEGEVFAHTAEADRPWVASDYPWVASAICHWPLYYEEVNLERVGWSHGLMQPYVSAAHFAFDTVALPYKIAVEPPHECIYTLGHYRPGNPAPFRIHYPPHDPRDLMVGGFAQAALVAGLIAVIP